MHRSGQDIPAVAPVVCVLLDQLPPGGFGSRFGARSVKLRADARHEIAEIVTNQHDYPVRPGNILSATNLGAIPVVLISQHDMLDVRADAN